MAFTYGYFLIGLIFALIPLLIHLITKKQIIQLKFPSLIFIKKAMQKESRKIRLREILLLIIRTLIIAFLVMSAAKPVIYYKQSKDFFISPNDNKSVVIILDNSYSMGLISEGESLFQKSKRLANDIILKMIKDNDNLSLILSADMNRVKFYDLTFNKNDVNRNINDAKISCLKNEFFKSIQDAEKILDKSANPHRIIYLITDLQKNMFVQDEQFIMKFVKCKYPVFLIKTGAEGKKNSALTGHQTSMKLNFKGDIINLRADLKNYSKLQNNLIIKTVINNEAINQKSISLNPEQKNSVNIRYVVSSLGYLGGYSEITDGDDLVYDNKNYFVLNIPAQLNVGIKNVNNELFYILNAVNPSYVLNNKIKSFINIKEYTSLGGSSRDNIFILDYDSLTADETGKLKGLLETTGLLIFPSKELNIDNFNSVFFKSGIINGLFEQKKEDTKNPFTIEFTDIAHPLFEIFKDITLFKDARIYSYYKLKLDTLSYNSRVLARFSNGDPAIVEYYYLTQNEQEKGRIILFTFMPDVKNTDFVYNPNFPPLVHQIIKYLMNRQEEDILNKFITGQTTEDVFSLTEAKKKSIEPLLNKGEDNIVNNVIEQPGIYRVDDKLIAVNPDYTESDLSEISPEEFIKNYKGLSVLSAENNKQVNEKIFSTLSAYPLWKMFLFIVLGLLVIELVIANEMYKFVLNSAFIKKFFKRN